MQRSVLSLAAVAALIACASGAACAGSVQPRVFAPGEVSSVAGVDCATFMPDGETVFFHQQPWPIGMIMVAHQVGGHWSKPEIAAFSGIWSDHDPVLSPDGSFMVFPSNRPDPPGGGAVHGGHLWRVDRTADGWSAPVRSISGHTSSRRASPPMATCISGAVTIHRINSTSTVRHGAMGTIKNRCGLI